MVERAFRTLDTLDPKSKKILLRADLNVPSRDGAITDLTRIERLAPTIRELSEKGGRVIVVSHFDRPGGKPVPEMSLAPVSEALARVLGHQVTFVPDCVGPVARQAVDAMKDGDVIVLENTRFYPGEEANDQQMSQELASLADVYVNDAFSAAHRAHASTEGVAHHLPSFAGRLMQIELSALENALENPARPAGAIIGGAKVSTKLDLLTNLLEKVDMLAVGGAMANTFLAAQGLSVGRSLKEEDMLDTARSIMSQAKERGCDLVLPVDVVVASDFMAGAPAEIVPVTEIPAEMMALDIGPRTAYLLKKKIGQLKTLVWNGPLGVFEMPPFDTGTTLVAQEAARLTKAGQLRTVAGGGDTVSALRHAHVLHDMSYVSTAGGAFLEWLEGKILPGVMMLEETGHDVAPL